MSDAPATPSVDDASSAEPSVSDFVAASDVGCPNCGYNLRGIADDRCPECGARLGLQIVEKREALDAYEVGLVGAAGGCTASAIWFAMVMLRTVLNIRERMLPIFLVPLVALLVQIVILMWWRSYRGRLGDRPVRRRWAIAAEMWLCQGAALFLMVVLSLGATD